MSDSVEDEKSTVTALEYIESQERLEKDASSILPGKFEKCTFPSGYIRQQLYACKTCSVDKEPAGMCYSCSIACHSSHELFELFPKRHFRCDCGLPGKLNNHNCTLMTPEKKTVTANEENKYNHNFQGRYCRCDQHYDPEKEEGTMYQCVACEDWFHDTCIGSIPEEIEEFESYICRDCVKKYPFLLIGKDARFSLGLSKGNEPVTKWIVHEQPKIDVVEITKEENAVEEKPPSTADSTEDAKIGEKRKAEDEQPSNIIINTFKKSKSDTECQNVDLDLLPEHDNIELFLQENWRQGLCKCTKCLESYKDQGVEYLLAEEKTFEPEEDEDAGRSLFEVGMEQLQRIDRVKAIESLRAYTTLASDLKTYLGTFKESGKIVTKEDIEEFFASKKQEKEQQ